MNITLVQQVATASSNPSVTRTLSGVTAGNTLIVPFDCGTQNPATITVSDNNGNNWEIAVAYVFLASSYHTIGVAFAPNANAGSTTVTVTNSAGNVVASMSEWNSGVAGASLGVDQTANATGTGTSPSSGSATTTSAEELLIGMIFASGGSISAGSGWTGLTNFLGADFPEYQIVSSIGSYAATASSAAGTYGAALATFLVEPLPIYNTIAGRFNSAGKLVGNLIVPIWTDSNVVPVTVNANTTGDQDLMSLIVPANTLNEVGRTLNINLKGVYSTPAASTAAIRIKVQLGSLTLLNIVSSVNAGSVTNNSFLLEGQISTQTAGSSGAFEASGHFTINLGSSNTSAASVFTDTNASTIGTLDTTVNQTLQITIAFSSASASNSAVQRQMVLQTVN